MSMEATEPRGELSIRTQAMPRDTNPSGDIFGGWMMAQMDVAGGITAAWRARGRIATVAVTKMAFHRPVRVGDVLCVYAEVARTGRTSLTVPVEAWIHRRGDMDNMVKVSEGIFTYVAIDPDGNKRDVPTA